jgi:hypothetical protein
MPPRSLARPAAFCAATTLASLVLASAVCAAEQPAVPPVSEIPVAPLPKPRKAAAPPPAHVPATTTTTVTTTTVTTPSLAAVTTPSTDNARGVPEAMPAATTPAAAVPPRIVLVDEEPARATHSHARELPEHEHGHHPKHGRHGRPFHPAPGIVVDVPSAQGGASAADLQRSARNNGYWPFRHCYEEGLERNQQLAGSVHFGLTRQAGGATTQLVESTIKDESVTLCVLREARHLELTWGAEASDAGADASADMKVSLATGDEPVPTPHAVPHAEELREALHASFPAVQQCYASGLARRPDEGGRMELRFHEKSSGEITEVSEDEPRFADVDVTRCVLGVYRTAKLPHPRGSHVSTFVYPLHFEAAPAASPAGK